MEARAYCLQLATEEYGTALALQKQLNQARREGIMPDVFIFLEHHPCYTVGRKGGFEHILVSDRFLAQEGIRVYETDRGGDITYHGPGQLVCYPILDLNDHGRDVHRYARNVEEAVIATLAAFGIQGHRKEEYPGVWVDNSKIAAEGIAVQRWVTMHGVSLNVCPDLNHFSFIVPCGISQMGVTSMEAILGQKVELAEVRTEMQRHLSRLFNVVLEDVSLDRVKEMLSNVQYREA